MKRLFLLSIIAIAPFALANDAPSRPADKGCKWEKLTDAALGLEAWVERCDYGSQKIDFVVQGHSLAERHSDGGAPEAVVDVIPLRPGESAEAGMKRVFAEHTAAKVARRCIVSAYKGWPARKGAQRFAFVPNAAFRKELDRTQRADEVPDPPCGDWGDAPDGIQYFEVQPGADKILFVRVGQDTPLFDEQTLRIISKHR
jgi:hypothetical protein